MLLNENVHNLNLCLDGPDDGSQRVARGPSVRVAGRSFFS